MVVKWETSGSEVDYTNSYLNLGQTKPNVNQTVPNSLEWYFHPYLGKTQVFEHQAEKVNLSFLEFNPQEDCDFSQCSLRQ